MTITVPFLRHDRRSFISSISAGKTFLNTEDAPQTIEDWIYFCEECAAEAFGETDEQSAAASAFVANMPSLSSLDNIRGYIGCVGVGLSLSYINANEGKLMMFVAQTALSAHSRRLRPTVNLTSREVSK